MRRRCVTCARVIEIVETAGAQVGLLGLVDIFIAEGFEREQVDAVLDARIGDVPTLRDRMTSKLTNALMQGLGMPGRQTPEDVMRVREAMMQGGQGTWSATEKPPDGFE
jgi:hypothetical protein